MAISEAWVDFIAGWASGAVSVLMCQPVDTVLTRFQANASTTTVALQETKYMVNHNGFKSLWRGSSAMISAVPMQNAMLMGGYGVGKKWSESSSLVDGNGTVDGDTSAISNNNNNNIYRNVFVGGFVGGVAQSFLMSPVELMKVNQQVNVSKSVTEAGMELVHGLGRLALFQQQQQQTSSSSWRGLNATLLRDGIPHGVWFAAYEWCKTAMTKSLVTTTTTTTTENNSPSTHEQLTIPLFSGAFAATSAWGVGYPADIIKTRIQASSSYHGIYRTAVELVAEANGNVIAAQMR
eukprot:scaffold6528_cov114-Cylindrotheca_fusiformis.AAC.5